MSVPALSQPPDRLRMGIRAPVHLRLTPAGLRRRSRRQWCRALCAWAALFACAWLLLQA